MIGLDLFSGIAGNSLGLGRYINTVAYCEQDRHAQSVLLSRMYSGELRPAPIWDDVTSLNRSVLPVRIDIIVGGFPCQDISCAGRGVGLEGKRSGLFFEIMRLAEEFKSKFLFLENVPAIRTRGLDTVIQELTKIGYDCRWTMLSAKDVGAPHKRERWFMLAKRRNSDTAHAEHNGRHGLKVSASVGSPICDDSQGQDRTREFTGMDTPEMLANGSGKGLQRRGSSRHTSREGQNTEQQFTGCDSGEYRRRVESRLGGMADGISTPLEQSEPEYLRASYWEKEPQDLPRVTQEKEQRVERIKRLGNAVVPLQALTAFEYLMGYKKETT